MRREVKPTTKEELVQGVENVGKYINLIASENLDHNYLLHFSGNVPLVWEGPPNLLFKLLKLEHR